MPRLFFIVFMMLALTQAFSQNARVKYNFNSDWKVFIGDVNEASTTGFSDISWKKVTLPYAWNEDEAFNKRIDSLSTGVVWYRKHFKIPSGDRGKKIFLEFEGIRMGGDFYLNGQFLGTHENGVMAFGFDVTDKLKPNEDNVISVRIDNRWDYKEKATGSKFQWNDRNFNANYGGITKNVWLYATDKLYQTFPLYAFLKTAGTYVYAKNYDVPQRSATVFVESQLKNEYNTAKAVVLEAEIRDKDGKLVKTLTSKSIVVKPGELQPITVSEKLTNLNFWSWGYGYLYTVTTRLKSDNQIKDEQKITTGFRKTEFKDGMIYLNDRVIMMHGFAQRTTNEWPAVGMSVPAWMSDYSNAMMVEGGGNIVRWMHITPWKQDIESCDRVGLIQAMPAGDAEKDVSGRWWTQRVELMREAIIYNRNSPSILFYEAGNESISAEHIKEMNEIRNQYDPYGGRASGSREMLDVPEAEYGGEMLYINKSATKPLWAMEYARDEALRKYWDEYTAPFHKNGHGPLYKGQDASEYNKNQDTFALDAVKQWYDYWRERPGTGTRVNAGGASIMFSESNTFTRSAQSYRSSGKTDAMRLPKDAFYANKVMWDGWVDPASNGLHIIGHWNYDAGVKKDVYVIAAGEKVELFLNNKSLGFGKQNNRFAYTFSNVQFSPGVLKPVSYNAQGKKLAEQQLVTAGPAVALRMRTIQHPQGLHADGADIALVDVEVIDANGNRCPTALNMVDFRLDGPAEWRGGIAHGRMDNFILSKSLPVQCAINRIMIRASTVPGKIALTASSEGLKSATVNLESLPVKTVNGLSTWFPSNGLRMRLDRGPTPEGQSFSTVRKSLKVVKVEAGANENDAKNSFDDNELSDWVNDGRASTAWIKYILEKPSTISSIALRLNKFRSRVYPLIIKVDDKVVFDGLSSPTLGYYNQDFKPTKGSSVTIQLKNTTGKDWMTGLKEMKRMIREALV